MVKAHIECLEKAAKSYGASKADWLKTLGTYPSKIKPGEGNDLVESWREYLAMAQTRYLAIEHNQLELLAMGHVWAGDKFP